MKRNVFLLIVLSFFARHARADELTLYLYESPGLDWNGPRQLGRSAIRNTTRNLPHSIGHVTVEVRCDAQGLEPEQYLHVGVTGASTDETHRIVVREGYGLGLLFHTFEGRFNTYEEVQEFVDAGYRGGGMAFLRFQIKATTCARLVQYIHEYGAKGLSEQYGLSNRPRYSEGSGCSAFSVSFLELAGLAMPEVVARWRRHLRVPYEWVGGPLTGNHIPMRRFLNPFDRDPWAMEYEPHFPVTFYDPDLMYRWTLAVWEGRETAPGLEEPRREQLGLARGLAFDATSVATPSAPIWLSADNP